MNKFWWSKDVGSDPNPGSHFETGNLGLMLFAGLYLWPNCARERFVIQYADKYTSLGECKIKYVFIMLGVIILLNKK